jgi:carbonic anhydrase
MTLSPARRSAYGRDVLASLVVFLVALPLSLGIAVASGAPVRAGLVAAIVGGIVVGLTGGAPLQVSGPAAGLTVIVYGYVSNFGLAGTCAIAVLAGLLQIAAGIGGIARAALAISPAVLQAMLAGIGVLITLGQIQVLVGHAPQSSAWNNIKAFPEHVATANPNALLVGGTVLVVLLVWEQWIAKRVRFLPGSLVAIAIGTVLAALLPQAPPLIEVPADLLATFDWPDFKAGSYMDLATAAAALAFIASAESLLCAVATDRLHGGPRANLNKELWAQGLGNVFSGSLGGLPITGVIVRSSANIAAGATSRLSAILHGVWMLVLVAFFAPYLGQIPKAALAALLVQVGLKLVKLAEIRKVAKFNEALLYFVTIVGVVFLDLLTGVALGVGCAVVMLLRKQTRVALNWSENDGRLEAIIRGNLSFLAVPSLSTKLEALPPGRQVTLHLEIEHLDHAAVEAIRSWKSGYERAGGQVSKPELDGVWRELRARMTPARAGSR